MTMNALRLLRLAVFGACVALAPAPSLAVQPNEILKDPALEKRARELSAELRCLVCQNQSIDDSSAPLARDLRLVVRERLVAGDTNEQVMKYVVQRYGEFILLRPPFRLGTILLWVTPLVAFGAGLAWLFVAWRRRSRLDAAPAVAPLTEDERKALEKVLEGR
jgi:cytochrome c-type biogenesis protein CcmH